MKVFEKLWIENNPPGTYHYNRETIGIARQYWKAALKEVLTNINWGNDSCNEYDEPDGDRIIYKEEIIEELEQ